MRNIPFFIILFTLFFSSCVNKKKLVYLNDIDQFSIEQINRQFSHDYPIRISKGDVLLITVSALDPEAISNFNLPLTSYALPGTLSVNTTPVLQNYIVDSEGYIIFPVIGKIKLESLTIDEASNLIKEKISQYANNPIVSVRFHNYQVTVLGEVNNPGRFTFNTQRISIFDAIGMASDLTIYGRRLNVLIIREVEGKLEYGRVDLSSSEIFSSPYYFLKQNDVIYVEPSGERTLATQQVNLYLSIFSTITTVTAVLFSFLR